MSEQSTYPHAGRSKQKPSNSFVHGHEQIDSSYDCYSKSDDRRQSKSADKWCIQGINFEKLYLEAALTPEQAFNGGMVNFVIPVHIKCPDCNELGSLGFSSCLSCHGAGFVIGKRSVPVNHPPGMQDNFTLQVPIADHKISNLLLVVHFRTDKIEE